MSVKANTLVLACLLAGTSAYGAPILVTSLAALGQNDSAAWGQLGGDLTALGTSFSATSVGGKAVSGSLASAGSVVSVVCPANPTCSWLPSGTGFSAADSLIVTSNANGGATGPLSLSFPTLFGAGLFIQSDIPGTYTAQILAFNGANQIASFTEASNANGDPIFIGVLDTIADITKITVNLSACGGIGCNVNDFAVDTLYLKGQASVGTPEPGSVLLFGGGLAALLGWRKRKRLSTASRRES